MSSGVSFKHIALAALGVLVAPVAASAETTDWSGFYVGAHVGMLAQGGQLSLAPTGDSPADAALNPDLGGTSFRGGLLGGYNFKLTPNTVAGIEADVGFGNAKSTVVSAKADVPLDVWNADNILSQKTNAHVRARFGYATGQVLAYAAAGVAISASRIDVIGNCPPDTYTTQGSSTLVGYSLGAGAEYALSKHLSARVEYIYDHYGHVSMDVGSGAPNYWQDRELNLETHSFRVAAAYRF